MGVSEHLVGSIGRPVRTGVAGVRIARLCVGCYPAELHNVLVQGPQQKSAVDRTPILHQHQYAAHQLAHPADESCGVAMPLVLARAQSS